MNRKFVETKEGQIFEVTNWFFLNNNLFSLNEAPGEINSIDVKNIRSRWQEECPDPDPPIDVDEEIAPGAYILSPSVPFPTLPKKPRARRS